jgi:uncharacterized protein YkwD
MTQHRRPVLAAALAALCALAATACGGDDDDGSARMDRSELGTPIVATNDDATGVVTRGPEDGPTNAVVEGGPDQSVLDDIAPPDEEALADSSGTCGAADATPSAQTLRETAQAVLCLLNAERSSRGLGALRMNSRLGRAASGHSRDMVRRRYFAHDSVDGKTMLDRVRAAGYVRPNSVFTVGENIGWGSGTQAVPRALVQSWMNSPPHRANILQARFRELGVGVVLGAPSAGVSGTAVTATTNFGRLSRR